MLLIAGIRIGREQTENLTSQEIADVISQDVAFSPTVIATEDLVTQIDNVRTYWSADQGYISPESWGHALDAFSTWGLNSGSSTIDVRDPLLAFDAIVDMSYWDEATPIVRGVPRRAPDRGEVTPATAPTSPLLSIRDLQYAYPTGLTR